LPSNTWPPGTNATPLPAAPRSRACSRWTPNTSAGAGHEGIDALIAGAQQHFPGHRFVLAGTPDAHHDVLRFGWTLHGPNGAAVVRGLDVAQVAADGRLARVTGFLDRVA